MSKINATIDSLFLVIGTGYSLVNIQTILGIVVLCLQIVWIITKIVVKVIKKVKAGEDISALDDEVDDVIGIIEHYANKGENTDEQVGSDKE